jgi:hypothetical protein
MRYDLIACTNDNILIYLQILRQFGGVYADVDYEFVRSIDPICAICSFFCGMSNTSTCEVNNGIIGSTPFHPILDRINREIREGIFKSQSAEKLRIIKSEVIYAFLSQKERERIDSVVYGECGGSCLLPGSLTSHTPPRKDERQYHPTDWAWDAHFPPGQAAGR